MAKFNKKNVENAPDKIKAGAEEMIKAPMWLIEQILLKHEKAVLEVMKELHDENERLKGEVEGADALHEAEMRLHQRTRDRAQEYMNALKSIIDVCEEHQHDVFAGAQANKLLVGILNIANYAAHGSGA